MKREVSLCLIGLALLAAVPVWAGGGRGAGGSAATTASSKVLTIGASADILTTDPHNFDQIQADFFFQNIASRLFKLGTDLVANPDLVVAYENPTPTTWKFTIRKDAVFSNGDPLTAQDVKYSFDRVRTTQSLVGYNYYKLITSFTIVDDYNFTLTTDVARPDLPAILSSHGGDILPSKYIAANGMDAYMKHPIGSGRYQLKEWIPDDHYTLIPYDKFYGTPASWESVTYRIIPEASTRVAELLTGGVDAIDNVPPNEWQRVNANTSGRGTEIVYGETSRVMLLAVRMTKGWALENAKLREAVELAIDKDAICNTLLRGAGIPTRTRVGSSVNGFNPAYFGSDKANLYNPERAKALVREAGFAPGQVSITLTSPNGRYMMDGEMAQMIAAYLEAVGIHVNLELVDSTVMGNMWGQKENKDLFLIGLSDGTYDAAYPLIHYGDPARVAGQTDYNNPEATALYQAALVNMNAEQRREQLRKIADIVAVDRPHISICQVGAAFGVSKRVNLKPRMDSSIQPEEVSLR
jgi:peptide/nickel transport system substrate-binding protein